MGDPLAFRQEALQQAHVDIAVLKTELAALRKDFDRLATTLERLVADLDNVQTTLSEARGGWRTLMLMGGAGASLGSVITWVASHVRFSA